MARLAAGFEPTFSLIAFIAALGGTIAWGWLVRWRAGRHQAALWKSFVLPAAGAALCWLLLMTLWLPVLDYARSHRAVVQGIRQTMDQPGCVEVFGITRGQAAALRFHGGLQLRSAGPRNQCPWLVVGSEYQAAASVAMDMKQWSLMATVRRPTDAKDNLLLYRHQSQPQPAR